MTVFGQEFARLPPRGFDVQLRPTMIYPIDNRVGYSILTAVGTGVALYAVSHTVLYVV